MMSVKRREGWRQGHLLTGKRPAAAEAFTAQDLEAAKEIIARDDVVDRLFDDVKMDMIELLKTSGDISDQSIDFLMIAKYLERIGDHAVNICEWIEFCKTGKMKNVRLI